MSIISFWSDSEKETGQTISTIATATMMAIEHNYKILTVSTAFNNRTVENSFWPENNKTVTFTLASGVQGNNSSMEAGIEGITTIIQSNRISKGIVGNYARVVFKDRLDVLTSPKTLEMKKYIEITKFYPNIINVANQDYNLVFVDIDKNLPQDIQKKILEKSDIIIISSTQGIKSLEHILMLKEQEQLFNSDKTMIVIGKYDKYSKYNLSNITRYLKEKKQVSGIPYNILLFEAIEEGKVADYFLKYINLSDKTDINSICIEETRKTCERIIYKLQELRMKG